MARILSFTGHSGSGKSTLAGMAIEAFPKRVSFVESWTDREKRDSDLSGEYRYVSQKEFSSLLADNGFLWHVEHGGRRYGTTRRAVQKAMDEDEGYVKIMILVPDVIPKLSQFFHEHHKQTHDPYDSWVPLHVIGPPREQMIERLAARGMSLEDATQRLQQERDWDTVIRHHVEDAGRHYRLIRNSGTLAFAFSQVALLLEPLKVI